MFFAITDFVYQSAAPLEKCEVSYNIAFVLPANKTEMKLTAKDKKGLIIGGIAFLVFLILLHGNELEEFRNTDKADATLEPVLYVVCLTPIMIFIRKGFNELTLKLKIFVIIFSMVVALMPMFLLAGLGKYIDYYTTDKEWKIENVTIITKSSNGGGRGGTTYIYTVKMGDTTLELSSRLNCKVEEVLHLKVCKTRLGMIIAEKYYH